MPFHQVEALLKFIYFFTNLLIDKLNYDVLYDDLVDNQFHFDYNISVLRLFQPNEQLTVPTNQNYHINRNNFEEIFRPIVGYSYMISNHGRVKNRDGKFMLPSPNRDGYYTLQLWNNGKYKSQMIHHLVAEYFLSNKNDYNIVKHKDNNITNNYMNNLYFTNKRNKKSSLLVDNNKHIYYISHRSQYLVRLKFNKKDIYLGYYNTIEEAQNVKENKLKELNDELKQINEQNEKENEMNNNINDFSSDNYDLSDN